MHWILRTLVLIVFAGHGAAFIAQPAQVREQLEGMPLTLRAFKALGAAELVGALVLFVVPLVDGPAWLAWAALSGLVVTMVGAIVVHIQRREPQSTGMTVVILLALLGLAVLGPAG